MRVSTAVAAVVGLFVLVSSGGQMLDSVNATGGDDPGGPSWVGDPWGEDELVFTASLRPFGSCDELLAYFRNEAFAHVTAYGLGYGQFHGLAAGSGGEEDSDSAATPTPAGGTGDFSGTNVQEAGVDEPDLVKTDGQRILAIGGGRLQVLTVTEGSPAWRASLALPEGHGHELLLDGDTALVVTRGGFFGVTPLPADDPAATSDDALYPAPSGSAGTTLTLVDVADPATPRVLDTVEIDGDYSSARMIDGIARVVVRSQPHDLGFLYPADGSAAAEEAALAHNRDVVATSTLEQWLPGVGAPGDADQQTVACDQVGRPAEFSGLGVTSVLTIDLDRGLSETGSAAVVADGQVVYASTGSLYVATTRWGAWRPEPVAAEDITTEIHRFDLSDPATARYTASGSVSGFVLNQFSFSEHAGHLRVATTEQPPWNQTGAVSESAVTVLAEQAGALVQVGRVDGLGPTEQIYAVRFLGDLAAVVTFRQVDPLYLLDLSVPTAPRVTGELKIPGFSSYLHPVAEGRLLGIGQDADAQGMVLGGQVSLFDVSDPANPQQLARHALGEGYSEVEYDHRAFLHWAPTGTAVLPFADFNGAVAAVALTVGDTTVSELGRVSHTAHAGGEPWDHTRQIRRSLVIGDTLYTVSEAGIAGAALADLAHRSWTAFG